MSLNYRVVRRTLNFDKVNPKEIVVAQAEQRAVTGFEEIISLIGQISSISRGDVLSVISTLTRLVADELAKGNIVDLGELGRLRLSLRSKACKTVEEFTRNHILTPALRFSPGLLLKEARRRVRVTLVDENGKAKGQEGEKPNNSSTPNTPPNGGGSGSGTSGSEENE